MEFQELLKLIQENSDTAVAVGTNLATLGKWSIEIIQKGKKIITYLIKEKKEEQDSPKISEDNVAVLIDINQRMLVDVKSYLDSREIDADFVVITNDPGYTAKVKFLDVEKPDEWNDLVYEFAEAMNAIKFSKGSSVNLHIFQASPLPLAYALGSVWGTVTEGATLYHYQNKTYYPVLTVNRKWREGKQN